MLQNSLVSQTSQVSLLSQIMSSPPALVALAALIANIVISVVNVFLTFHNRRRDSHFKIELSFYELTVLKSLTELFRFIAAIKAAYCEMVNKYTVTDDPLQCREQAEGCISVIDGLKESNENDVFPYLDGFSTELGRRLRELFETYYDSVTNIVSKYSQPKMNGSSLMRLGQKFGSETTTVIKSMYDLSKSHCPK